MAGQGMLKYVMYLGLALIFTALFIPMGLTAIADANMTGTSAIVANVFTVVLPIMVIFSIALAFMPPEIKSRVGL